MSEFALLINSTFREFRYYDEQPEDIPHKGVMWLPVSRVYGEPFDGLENGVWVVRTVDPATLPPPVPESITPRQCRLILAQQHLLDSVEAMIAQQDRATQITWEYALEFRRDDPLLNALAGPDKLNLSKEQIDQFFIASAQL